MHSLGLWIDFYASKKNGARVGRVPALSLFFNFENINIYYLYLIQLPPPPKKIYLAADKETTLERADFDLQLLFSFSPVFVSRFPVIFC